MKNKIEFKVDDQGMCQICKGKKMLQENLMTGKTRWVYKVTSIDCRFWFDTRLEAIEILADLGEKIPGECE